MSMNFGDNAANIAPSGTAPDSLFMSSIVLDHIQWFRRAALDSRASDSSFLGVRWSFYRKGFFVFFLPPSWYICSTVDHLRGCEY